MSDGGPLIGFSRACKGAGEISPIDALGDSFPLWQARASGPPAGGIAAELRQLAAAIDRLADALERK